MLHKRNKITTKTKDRINNVIQLSVRSIPTVFSRDRPCFQEKFPFRTG